MWAPVVVVKPPPLDLVAIPAPHASQPNERWSLDYVHDALRFGRKIAFNTKNGTDATNNWPEVSASAHDQALLNQILKAESSGLIPTQPRPQ